MDLFEAIRTRRSIRSFTDEPVSQEDMDRMLEAAMCAPSANNRQLWHFVVIRDREMLRKVAEVHPYAKMAAGAAAAVIICADLIVLGHTDQEFKAQERFRAERVHNEDW